MTISEKKRGAMRFERKKQQIKNMETHKGRRSSGGKVIPRTPGQVEGEGIDMGEISYEYT